MLLGNRDPEMARYYLNTEDTVSVAHRNDLIKKQNMMTLERESSGPLEISFNSQNIPLLRQKGLAYLHNYGPRGAPQAFPQLSSVSLTLDWKI